MRHKEDIKKHLKTYRDKAVSNGLNAGKLDTLLLQLNNAIDAYYSNDYTGDVAKCVNALTHLFIRAGVKYKGQTSSGVPSGLCRGWDNVTDLFLADEVIYNCGYADFYNSITEEVVTDEATGESDTVYKSSLFESWTALLLSDSELITQDLAAIADVASSKYLGDSLGGVYEPKEIESVPDLHDVAKQIYIDRRYKELIKFYSMSVYVPSFL